MELEQSRLDQARELAKLKDQKDMAIQGQESYKAILQRIQKQQSVQIEEFPSPYSFGNRVNSQEAERLPTVTDEMGIVEQTGDATVKNKSSTNLIDGFREARESVKTRGKSFTGTRLAKKEE